MFKKGFQFLELGLIFFIIGLLVSVITATGYSYRKAVLIKTQQEIISRDMEYAKQLAKTKAEDVDVYFYAKTYTINSGGNVSRYIELQQGFTVMPEHLGFKPNGNPKYSGTIYLSYKSVRVARFTVAVGSGLMQWKSLD